MAPLARLPVFLALDGKRARGRRQRRGGGLEGGTALGGRRAGRRLCGLRAGDDLRRASPSSRRADRSCFIARSGARRISPAPRSRSATSTMTTRPARFAAAARGAGVPVNVIDKPAFCDFAFGAIVNRSPLVIGISTDGAAPVFAQAIRAELEALIPRGFARWAEAAQRWRDGGAGSPACRSPAGGGSGSGSPRSRCAQPGPRAGDADLDRLMAETQRRRRAARRPARVTLVGAGPGDPELLTLRAVRALQIGRRHPDRRSGRARDPRLRAPRGEEDAWSARPASGRPAGRTRSTR